MFRLMGTIFKDTHILKSTVICDATERTRTKKVFGSLENICHEFDLEKPLWLEKNKKEFIRHARTRFTQDNFIEQIEFDYLDFQVIEEDY